MENTESLDAGWLLDDVQKAAGSHGHYLETPMTRDEVLAALADRDRLAAENARLRGALTDLLPYLEDLVNHGDVLGSRKMVEYALPSLRSLVEAPR